MGKIKGRGFSRPPPAHFPSSSQIPLPAESRDTHPHQPIPLLLPRSPPLSSGARHPPRHRYRRGRIRRPPDHLRAARRRCNLVSAPPPPATMASPLTLCFPPSDPAPQAPATLSCRLPGGGVRTCSSTHKKRELLPLPLQITRTSSWCSPARQGDALVRPASTPPDDQSQKVPFLPLFSSRTDE